MRSSSLFNWLLVEVRANRWKAPTRDRAGIICHHHNIRLAHDALALVYFSRIQGAGGQRLVAMPKDSLSVNAGHSTGQSVRTRNRNMVVWKN